MLAGPHCLRIPTPCSRLERPNCRVHLEQLQDTHDLFVQHGKPRAQATRPSRVQRQEQRAARLPPAARRSGTRVVAHSGWLSPGLGVDGRRLESSCCPVHSVIGRPRQQQLPRARSHSLPELGALASNRHHRHARLERRHGPKAVARVAQRALRLAGPRVVQVATGQPRWLHCHLSPHKFHTMENKMR